MHTYCGGKRAESMGCYRTCNKNREMVQKGWVFIMEGEEEGEKKEVCWMD